MGHRSLPTARNHPTPIMKCSGRVRTGVRTACNVTLTKQRSSTDCVLDQTFGCNNDGATMWVGPVPGGNKSKGCRGVFSCDGHEGVHCGKDTPPGVDADDTCACFKDPPGPSPSPGPTPVNPPKGKCVAALTEMQKMILLNTEVGLYGFHVDGFQFSRASSETTDILLFCGRSLRSTSNPPLRDSRSCPVI